MKGSIYFYLSLILNKLNNSKSLIAPFWTDVSSKNGENYYRIATDLNTLKRIHNEIERIPENSSNFLPKWAAVVTWHKIQAFNHKRFDFENSLQLILASDSIQSYVLFNYGNLTWPNPKVKVEVVSGYNLGDNINFFEMNESFSTNITDLQYKSNVDFPGKWIFRVDTFQESNVIFLSILADKF
jgi:hypothetical protein